MRLLIFGLLVSSAVALKLHDKHPCDLKECRAGRECVVVEGEARCLCVVSCPDHSKPVCGTDEVSYHNHCRLHQRACLTGQHIGIKHKGMCKKSYDKLLKKDRKKSLLSKADLEDELQNDLIKLLREDEKDQPKHKKNRPAVCYAPQRDALRFLVVEHYKEDLKSQPWYVEGMTYRESLWGWFFFCDKNKDNYLTPEELLKCSKDVAFFARPGQDNKLTKALCIDALVNDGDKNQDWKLDFEEYTTVMSPNYKPKDKKCSLEGKDYVDGEEIHVECNYCVCAVGNWVCASTDCVQSHKEKNYSRRSQFHPQSGHGNELSNDIDTFTDTAIDHETVADLWMEENHKAKKKAKDKKKEEEFDVIDDSFLDFDDVTPDDDKTTLKEEEDDLFLDDYYSDLLEKSKSKSPQKKKLQLEKALKEVKMLQRKTKELEKLLLNKKEDKTSPKAPSLQKKTLKKTRKDKKPYFENVSATRISKNNKNGIDRPIKPRSYYDEAFKKTNWNDLIDWGKLKKMEKHAKKYAYGKDP